MKVLLADDHALFRQGILLALQDMYDDLAVDEAGTVADTLRRLGEGAGYDLVLFDLVMPDAAGTASLGQVVRKAAPSPVVVISASQDVEDIRGAIEVGARGYIFKSSSIEALRHGLPLVMCGETYVPMPSAALLQDPPMVVNGRMPVPPPATFPAPGSAVTQHQFTPRQLEVARLLLEGHSNKQIGRQLGLLEGTVKVHIREIMRKLGVQNRTQAALVAAQLDLFGS